LLVKHVVIASKIIVLALAEALHVVELDLLDVKLVPLSMMSSKIHWDLMISIRFLPKVVAQAQGLVKVIYTALGHSIQRKILNPNLSLKSRRMSHKNSKKI
jgi:hypothetical protein